MITTNEFFSFFGRKMHGLGKVILGSNSPPRRLRLGVWRGRGKVRRRRRDWPLSSVHKLTFKSHQSLVFPNLSDFHIKIHFAWLWTKKFCTTNRSYLVFVTSSFTSCEQET